MYVKKFKNSSGEDRYYLLDEDFYEVKEANLFLDDYSFASPNTLRSYAYRLRLYYAFLEIRGLNILDVANDENISGKKVLLDFINWLKIDTSDKTVKRKDSSIKCILNTVMVFYRFLSDTGRAKDLRMYKRAYRILKNSSTIYSEQLKGQKVRVSKINIKTTTKRTKTIRQEELELIIKNCNCLRDKVLIVLMRETGFRIGEALGLRISDLCLEEGIIRVRFRSDNANGARAKYAEERDIFIPNYLQKLIIEYVISIEKYNSDYLFISLKGKTKGHAMTEENALKLFNRLGNKCGFHFTSHMLRHTKITELAEHDVDAETIRAVAGHKNTKTTQDYIHLNQKKLNQKLQPLLSQRDKDMEDVMGTFDIEKLLLQEAE